MTVTCAMCGRASTDYVMLDGQCYCWLCFDNRQAHVHSEWIWALAEVARLERMFDAMERGDA